MNTEESYRAMTGSAGIDRDETLMTGPPQREIVVAIRVRMTAHDALERGHHVRIAPSAEWLGSSRQPRVHPLRSHGWKCPRPGWPATDVGLDPRAGCQPRRDRATSALSPLFGTALATGPGGDLRRAVRVQRGGPWSEPRTPARVIQGLVQTIGDKTGRDLMVSRTERCGDGAGVVSAGSSGGGGGAAGR